MVGCHEQAKSRCERGYDSGGERVGQRGKDERQGVGVMARALIEAQPDVNAAARRIVSGSEDMTAVRSSRER